MLPQAAQGTRGPRKLAEGVKNLHAMPRGLQANVLLVRGKEAQCLRMKRVARDAAGHDKTRIGVTSHFFKDFMSAVKLTFGQGLGNILRASRRRLAAVLMGRLPVRVTVNLGSPLSVTINDWPGSSDVTRLGA